MNKFRKSRMVIKKIFFKLKEIFKNFYIRILYFFYKNISRKIIKIKTKNILNKNEFYLYFKPNWYHDFSVLGLKTYQHQSVGYKLHQEIKQKVIFDYINKAIKLCKINNPSPISAVELFCADGYFLNYSVINGVDQAVGIDLEEESGESEQRRSVLDQARLATKLLGNTERINFYKQDVFLLDKNFDIGICVGGLYHITEPKKLLELLSNKINKYLVVQSVVSLADEDENYFESPAPGWAWGCRFSHKYLLKMLEQTGWVVLEKFRNELLNNTSSSDKGSSYCLCVNKNFSL